MDIPPLRFLFFISPFWVPLPNCFSSFSPCNENALLTRDFDTPLVFLGFAPRTWFAHTSCLPLKLPVANNLPMFFFPKPPPHPCSPTVFCSTGPLAGAVLLCRNFHEIFSLSPHLSAIAEGKVKTCLPQVFVPLIIFSLFFCFSLLLVPFPGFLFKL